MGDLEPDLQPLAVIEPREDRNEDKERKRRDTAITLFLVVLVTFGLLWAFAVQYTGMELRAEAQAQEQPCPNTSTQLNAYEYELQRGRCEALAHGAAGQLAREPIR